METHNNNQLRIIELLEKYIKELKQKEEKLAQDITFKSLYEELLPALKKKPEELEEQKLEISLLFSTLYKDDIYLSRFYSLLPNLKTLKDTRKEFKELVNKIYKDYQDNEKEIQSLDAQIKRSNNLLSTARRTKYNLKYSVPVTQYRYDVENIKAILSYFETIGEISNKEFLLLVNEIELYNRRVTTEETNKREVDYNETLYNEVPNIINAGYQEHDKIEVLDERKATLDKMADEILNYIEFLSPDEIIENIEKYQQYNIEDNEYSYIVTRLLDKYQEELISLYELLSDKEIFLRRKDRLEVIRDYYKNLHMYLFLRNYYETLNEYEELEPTEEELEEEPEEVNNNQTEPRKLIYATAPNNPSKTRIISDMNDLPKEYYEKIEKLLNDFKYRKRDHKILKTLKRRVGGKLSSELKDDQIRIVYKQINKDTFIIVGVFTKKDNNDRRFNLIQNRAIPIIDTEEKLQRYLALAEKQESEISQKVKEEGRSYSR